MKVTLDLETSQLVVPKNFFKSFEKQNDMIKKMGGEPLKPVEVIKKAFDTAMADTDKYLKVKD